MTILNNKIILITGASRGIGKAVALLCAENGAQVIINYLHNEVEAREIVNTISQNGLKITALQGDVSSENDIKKMASLIKDQFGRIDILVNNAGILVNNPLLLASPEEFDQMIKVNCKGVFLCTKYFSKMMMKQKKGKIINISSVTGITGSPGQSIYSGSKAFVIGFTKSSAQELGRYGITVNAVAPGLIATDLTKDMRREIVEKNISNTSLGRIGTPIDIARVVVFLSSDSSDFITGQVIRVDGGQSN